MDRRSSEGAAGGGARPDLPELREPTGTSGAPDLTPCPGGPDRQGTEDLGALEDLEIHPMYEVGAHLDALFSAPLYRCPENPHMARWRELGERLLALGEHELAAACEATEVVVEGRLAARRRRRRGAGRTRRAGSPAPIG